MPATSQAQYRLMKGICEGTYPDGYRGISKKLACEFVQGMKEDDIKDLAERLHPKKKEELQ